MNSSLDSVEQKMVLLCDLVCCCGYDLTWECNTYVVICNMWGEIRRIGQNHVYVRKEQKNL